MKFETDEHLLTTFGHSPLTMPPFFHLFVILLLLSHRVLTEDSFCGNKCFGAGVVTSQSCYCDKSCSLYNDCCSDSRFLEPSRNVTTRELRCKMKALVVRSCAEAWNGPDFIAQSCTSESESQADPVGKAPVTSETTGVTYSNYHCAICNGDAAKVIVWNIKVSCPLTNSNIPLDKDEAFYKYLFYNTPTNEWGYVLRDVNTKKISFYGCVLAAEIPEPHKPKTRPCVGEQVSTCSQTWKKDIIKDMCGTYTDPVFSNGTKYKNFYCAMCNRVDQSHLSCGEAMGPRTNMLPEDDRNKLSFPMLLDINFSEGNTVGQRSASVRCVKGEIFDPFARRCRNIVCGIPGFVLRNGMCMAEIDSPSL